METLECNHIIYKEDLIKDQGLLDYLIDQLATDVGKKLMDSLLTNGISICRADSKMYQLLDINAVNIIDTVQIIKIISCKDCKYYDPKDRNFSCNLFSDLGSANNDNDFCAWAERKDNG